MKKFILPILLLAVLSMTTFACNKNNDDSSRQAPPPTQPPPQQPELDSPPSPELIQKLMREDNYLSPKIKIEFSTNHPTIDQTSIKRAFLFAEPAVHRCYSNALATSPDLAGNASISLMLDQSAALQSQTIDSDIQDTPFIDCLQIAIKNIRFPQNDKHRNAAIQFSLKFSSEPPPSIEELLNPTGNGDNPTGNGDNPTGNGDNPTENGDNPTENGD